MNQPGSNSITVRFRSDINALRAVAVAMVVLYHLRVPGFSGGFQGVDVFFVISGFLMTQIITRGLNGGHFSILNFYLARTRRIVPALLVMCVAALSFAIFAADPITVRNLARSTVTSLLFVSNFEYAARSGYFSSPPEANWLIHTWSLSVEWQFYLLYPILLSAIWRVQILRSHLLYSVAVLATFSFGAAMLVLISGRDWLLDYSFYMLPMRAWELLVGGVVALMPTRQLVPHARRTAVLAGHAVLLASLFVCDANDLWPGPLTVLPVIATALVIAGGQSAGWTKLSPVASIGRWSYSIYLWHWPIVAAINYFLGHDFSLAVAFIVVVLSTLLGASSYSFVETRLAQLIFTDSCRSASFAGFGVLALLIAGTAFVTHGFEILKLRKPGELESERQIDLAYSDWPYPGDCASFERTRSGLELCKEGGGGRILAMVIGDSIAETLAGRYARLPRRQSDPAILFATRGGCVPLPKVMRLHSIGNCARSTDEAFRLAQDGHYPRVVLVASWRRTFLRSPGEPTRGRVCFVDGLLCHASTDDDEYLRDSQHSFDSLGQILQQIASQGAKISVIESLPDPTESDLDWLYKQLYRTGSISDISVESSSYRLEAAFADRLVSSLARFNGVTVVDPIPTICGTECPIVRHGTPLYTLGAHFHSITVKGAAFSFLDPLVLG